MRREKERNAIPLKTLQFRIVNSWLHSEREKNADMHVKSSLVTIRYCASRVENEG